MKILLIGLIFVLLTTALAVADLLVAESEVVLNVDYRTLTDRNQNLAVSAAFTVENTGADNVSATIAVSGLPSGYTDTTPSAQKTVNVPAFGAVPVTLSFNVPHQSSSGKSTIGTVTVTGGGAAPISRTLGQDTKSMLVLDSLDVDYTDEDGGSQSDDFGRDEVGLELNDPVRPGSEVTFKFDLENFFNSNYPDGDIDNIKLTIEADDDDLYGDFDEEYDLDDIDANDEDSFTVSFTVAEDADVGDYILTITLEGEDEKGLTHKVEKELTLEVKRQRDDLRIIQALLNPSTVSCEGDFTLDVEVRNFGTDDQRDAAVSIFNEKLGINENIRNIQIDEFADRDDRWRQIFSFDAGDAAPGSYVLDLRVYYDGIKVVDTEGVQLLVKECEAQDEAETTANQQTPPQPAVRTSTLGTSSSAAEPAATQPSTATSITAAAIADTFEVGRSTDDLLVAVLVVGIVLALAMIGIFIAILLK